MLNEKDLMVEICTSKRYDGLLLSLESIAMQSLLPNLVLIHDDNDENIMNLNQSPIYQKLFGFLQKKGCKVFIMQSKGMGPAISHQIDLEYARQNGYEFVYRLDDDEIMKENVLENLYNIMKDETIGSAAPCVLPIDARKLESGSPNLIKDIYANQNVQWYDIQDKSLIDGNEHLYSSFMYRVVDADNYMVLLSKKGFREETLFSNAIFKKNKRLLIDPNSIVIHLQLPGGVDKSTQEDFNNDDDIFKNKMQLDIDLKDKTLIVSQHGLGDQIVFSMFEDQLKEKYGEKLLISTNMPDLFSPETPIIHADLANIYLNGLMVLKDSVYDFMSKRNYLGTLSEAFQEIHGLDASKIDLGELKPVVEIDKEKKVLVCLQSCVLFDKDGKETRNAKDYPFSQKLVDELNTKGYQVVQIGSGMNKKLENVDYLWDKSLSDLVIAIESCSIVISVDTFLQHFSLLKVGKPCFAIFGPSDPLIFGHPENINLQKSRSYIRPDIHGQWTTCEANDERFLSVNKVMEAIAKEVNK